MKKYTITDFKNNKYKHICGNVDSLSNDIFLDLLNRFTDGIIYANIDVEEDDIEEDDIEDVIYDLAFNIVNINTLTHEDVKRYIDILKLDEDEVADMFDINTSHIRFNAEYYLIDGTTMAQALIAFFIENACGMRVETSKNKINTTYPNISVNTCCESE